MDFLDRSLTIADVDAKLVVPYFTSIQSSNLTIHPSVSICRLPPKFQKNIYGNVLSKWCLRVEWSLLSGNSGLKKKILEGLILKRRVFQSSSGENSWQGYHAYPTILGNAILMDSEICSPPSNSFAFQNGEWNKTSALVPTYFQCSISLCWHRKA